MVAHRTQEEVRMAVVGGGRRCLSMLRMLESKRLSRLKARIVGVADRNPEAVGFVYARERGIYTTTDYLSLLDLDDLDLIIELTGDEKVLQDLMATRNDSVRVLDYTASRLFQDIVAFGQQIERQEDEISLSRSVAEAMIKGTGEGVMVLDTDYRIIRANDVALRWARISRDEALGRYCFQVLHGAIGPCDSPDTPCPMKQTEATGQSAFSLHEFHGPEGEVHFCDVSTYPVFDRDGQVVQVLEIFRDVTDHWSQRLERRAELIKQDCARLVQEDKLIALGKLVASVAHEINNPIGSIINFAKLTRKLIAKGRTGPQDLNRYDQYLDVAVGEAERCGNIVANLLSFSRQQSREPRSVDLVEVVRQIIMLTGHRMELASIKVATDFDADRLTVWGDYNQLQQALTNLIFNAIEAMPDGGTMIIRGGMDQSAAQVWIEVTDTGEGIAAENLPFIFDPFFTTKAEGQGVGLGLSMVYGIILDHRGTVAVDSPPDGGTTFRIELPAHGGGPAPEDE